MSIRIKFWRWFVNSFFKRGVDGDFVMPKWAHWLYAALYPIQSLKAGRVRQRVLNRPRKEWDHHVD